MFGDEEVWVLKAVLELVGIWKGEEGVLLLDRAAGAQVEGNRS